MAGLCYLWPKKGAYIGAYVTASQRKRDESKPLAPRNELIRMQPSQTEPFLAACLWQNELPASLACFLQTLLASPSSLIPSIQGLDFSSNMAATSHMGLLTFKWMKIKQNGQFRSLVIGANFKASGYVASTDTEHFHHCKKFYWTLHLGTTN